MSILSVRRLFTSFVRAAILGLAYPPLLGPPTNYTEQFADAVARKTGMRNMFGMQCCGWVRGAEAQKVREMLQAFNEIDCFAPCREAGILAERSRVTSKAKCCSRRLCCANSTRVSTASLRYGCRLCCCIVGAVEMLDMLVAGISVMPRWISRYNNEVVSLLLSTGAS